MWLVELEPIADERGFFARSWSSEEFRGHGLDDRLTQTSVSFNYRRGTLRGLHYQAEPHAEAKLVRCTAGAIFDVAVDVRPGSVTFGKWVSIELSSDNRHAFYLPAGFAHGFQSLTADSEVLYQISVAHAPDHSRGVRWDDPAIAIQWPLGGQVPG